MQCFVYGEFNQPVTFSRVAQDEKTRLTVTAASGNTLELRYGISFISADQAKKNLREEIPAWDFDGLKRHARTRWNDTLRQIRVEGGSPAQRRVFYTAPLPAASSAWSISPKIVNTTAPTTTRSTRRPPLLR